MPSMTLNGTLFVVYSFKRVGFFSLFLEKIFSDFLKLCQNYLNTKLTSFKAEF